MYPKLANLQSKNLGYLAIIMGFISSQSIYAGPLVNTDDATIIDQNHCEIDSSYINPKLSDSTYSLDLTCTVIPNLESKIGFSRLSHNTQERVWTGELKTVVKPLDTWGVASSLSASHNHYEDEKSNWDWFFNVPITYVVNNDLSIDVNVGYEHSDSESNLVRWGTAGTYQINEKFAVVLESYNLDKSKPFYQAVIQHELVPDVFTLEASVGDRFKSFNERWVGLGVNFKL